MSAQNVDEEIDLKLLTQNTRLRRKEKKKKEQEKHEHIPDWKLEEDGERDGREIFRLLDERVAREAEEKRRAEEKAAAIAAIRQDLQSDLTTLGAQVKQVEIKTNDESAKLHEKLRVLHSHAAYTHKHLANANARLDRNDNKLLLIETNLDDVKERVSILEQITRNLQLEVKKDSDYAALLRTTEAHPRKKLVLNDVSKMFSIMGTGYRSAASGIVPRNANTAGDMVSSALAALGNHVPGFGWPATALASIASAVINKKEKARFYTAAKDILPRKLDDFSESFALKFIQWLDSRYPGVFDNLSAEQSTIAAQKALGIILKELHDLKNLNTEEPLDQQFLNILENTDDFIHYIERNLKENSPKLNSLTGFDIAKAKASATQRTEPTPRVVKPSSDKCVVM